MAALSLLHLFSPMTIRSYLALVAIALAAVAAPLHAQVPQYDHVVVVIFENHSYGEIIGNPAAPTFNSLAANGANIVPAANDPTGSRSGSHGLRHPSQPNYLELYSGDNQGVIQDGRPGDPTAEPFSSPPPFKTPNLGALLRTAGYTFLLTRKVYPASDT